MYQDVFSCIYFNNKHSRWFPIKQSVWQGGVLSTTKYFHSYPHPSWRCHTLNCPLQHLALFGLWILHINMLAWWIKASIVLINESKIAPKFSLRLQNYTMAARRDRPNGAGGGTAIFVRRDHNIQFTDISIELALGGESSPILTHMKCV